MDSKETMPLLNLPCHGQTDVEVKDWLKANVVVGCVVVIRSTLGGFTTYRKARVDGTRKGRIYLDAAGESGGAAFYFSGKNCFHPKGQTRLVVPTDAVLAQCGVAPVNSLRYAPTTL